MEGDERLGRGEHEMRKPVRSSFVAIQWRKDEGLEKRSSRTWARPSQGDFLASRKFHEVRQYKRRGVIHPRRLTGDSKGTLRWRGRVPLTEGR